MEIHPIDELIGSTACLFTVTCKHTTDKMVKFPWGYIPVCNKHIRWMEAH